METLVEICLGISLSAACGLRIFVPPLVMGIMARWGFLHLGAGSDWMASTPALVALGVATFLEVAAYHIPWLDNALDLMAGPLAILAGIAVSFAVLNGEDPLLRWALALVAGGGAAAAVQTATTLARHVSSLTTGGLLNPVLAAGEALGAFLVSVAAILIPLVALAAGGTALLIYWRRNRRSTAEAIV
ncbi:MAG: DUF4126 domain-containing protein [Acidobacteriota bacterium]